MTIKERVSVFIGNAPVLIVAPHGFDDPLTDVIAEKLISFLDCYGVINRGWQRSDQPDFWTSKANCNNVTHCHSVVVQDEFLEPVLEFAGEMIDNYGFGYVFQIHAASITDAYDVVLGYGQGKTNSLTCESWMKNAFVHALIANGLNPVEGKNGGKYAGRNPENLNQLFRVHYPDTNIYSMQLELTKTFRSPYHPRMGLVNVAIPLFVKTKALAESINKLVYTTKGEADNLTPIVIPAV